MFSLAYGRRRDMLEQYAQATNDFFSSQTIAIDAHPQDPREY